MSPARRRPGSTGTLIVLCFALAALIRFELGDAWVTRAALSTPTPPELAVDSEPDFDLEPVPLARYAEIARRPLFAPDRRPPAGAVVEMAPAAGPDGPGELILRGVALAVGGIGARRLALLKVAATREVVRAVEGQELAGWQISAIESGRVVLRAGDGEWVLELPQPGGPAVTAP